MFLGKLLLEIIFVTIKFTVEMSLGMNTEIYEEYDDILGKSMSSMWCHIDLEH